MFVGNCLWELLCATYNVKLYTRTKSCEHWVVVLSFCRGGLVLPESFSTLNCNFGIHTILLGTTDQAATH